MKIEFDQVKGITQALKRQSHYTIDNFAEEMLEHVIEDEKKLLPVNYRFVSTQSAAKKVIRKFMNRYSGFVQNYEVVNDLESFLTDGTYHLVWAGKYVVEQVDYPEYSKYFPKGEPKTGYKPGIIIYCTKHHRYELVYVPIRKPRNKTIPLCEECSTDLITDFAAMDSKRENEYLTEKIKYLENKIKEMDREKDLLKLGLDDLGYKYESVVKRGKFKTLDI